MGGSQILRGYLYNNLITKLSTGYAQAGRSCARFPPSDSGGEKKGNNTLPHRGVVGIRKNESKTLSPPAEDKESKGRKGIRPFDYNLSSTFILTPRGFHSLRVRSFVSFYVTIIPSFCLVVNLSAVFLAAVSVSGH